MFEGREKMKKILKKLLYWEECRGRDKDDFFLLLIYYFTRINDRGFVFVDFVVTILTQRC